jgi:hypothetical protein
METLIRQKVCKITTFLLNTKLEYRKKRKENGFVFGAIGLGVLANHYPAFRTAWRIATIRARLEFVLNKHKTKNPISVTYRVSFYYSFINLLFELPLSETTFIKYVPEVNCETSTLVVSLAFGITSTN